MVGDIGDFMYRFVSALSRNAKRFILLMIDVALVPVALATAFALQQNGLPSFEAMLRNWLALPLMAVGWILLGTLGRGLDALTLGEDAAGAEEGLIHVRAEEAAAWDAGATGRWRREHTAWR